jgi:hypothetical protein
MSWVTSFRRFWWLLPVSTGLIGILMLVRAAKRPPQPTPARIQVLPKPNVRPRVQGVVSSPLGSEEHIVAMGDFNDDGQQDLAVTNGDPDTGLGVNTDPQGAVTIWLGDGHGSLRHGPVLEAIEATLLASLDADGDGDTDLLAGSRNDDSLLLWRNEGRGKLVPQAIPVSWGVDDLTTGDIDGDGDVDIVIPGGYQLEFGLNDGQGHFRWQEQELRAKPVDSEYLLERVALADVDGDHDLDIVSSQRQGSILFNDGHGKFGHEQRLSGGTGYSLAIGDLNGDAHPDLVIDQGGGTLALYLNDGTGHFGADSLSQTLTHAGSQESNWVALGDVDRDGDLDIVFNSYWDEVWVHLNNGAAQFEPAYHVPTPHSALQELNIADIDHDGWLDILSPIPEANPRPNKPVRSALTSLRPRMGNEYYEEVEQMPTAVGGGQVQGAVEAVLQPRLVLPPGYILQADRAAYVLEFIVGKDGHVEQPTLEWKLTPSTDSAMLDALRHLQFVPGRLHGQPVRVILRVAPHLSGKGPDQTFPPTPLPGEDPIYAQVEQMPTFVGGGAIVSWLREQGLNQFIFPDSVRQPLQGRLVVGLIVEKDGATHSYRKLESINSEVDGAFTSALGNLPRLVPGRHHGRPVRVALQLIVESTDLGAALTQQEAEHLEAQTRQQGMAQRRPGESDAKFLRRVLPLSLAYNGHPMSYAWRPSAFGKQLFIAIRGREDNEYGTDLLVLDPYRPNMYALRVLTLGSMGDLTNLESLFFADIDHDGRQELLALKECSLRDVGFTDKHGQSSYGHFSHYQTDVFRLAGTDHTGRPQYQPDVTDRSYLDELSTAAEVRSALAKHQRQEAIRPVGSHPNSAAAPTNKKLGAASPPKSDPSQ